MARKLFFLTILLISNLLFNGCTAPTTESYITPGTMEELIELAKKEGEVVVVSGETPELLKPLTDAFNRRFPDISLKLVQGVRAAEVPSRVITEYSAGKVFIDVNMTSMGMILPLLERDLLLSSDWTGIEVNESRLLLDGRAPLISDDPWVMIYNRNLLPDSDTPRTWEDLLDPRFKGKIIFRRSLLPLGAMILSQGEEKAWEYTQKLYNNGLTLTLGTALDDVDKLLRGERVIGNRSLSAALELMDKGAPIGILPISPQFCGVSIAVAFKRCEHPNAAALFLAWLTSDEAVAAWETIGFGPIDAASGTRYAKVIRDLKIELVKEDTLDRCKLNRSTLEKFASMLGVKSN